MDIVKPQGNLMQLVCIIKVAIAGAVVYFGVAWGLRIPEMRMIMVILTRIYGRFCAKSKQLVAK